jgi:hypothetical protein
MQSWISRAALSAVLACAALTASAVRADTLYMKIDGVTGDADANQPLGAGAFQLLTFTLNSESTDLNVVPGATPKPATLKDVHFDMRVTPTMVPLFGLAAQAKLIPKASFVAVGDDGKLRYRVDLEGVVIRSLGLQTLGNRDAVASDLGYQRVRFLFGEGKDAVVSGYDRVKNAPWK